MEKTKFSFDTIKDFDNHINASIYGYGLLHDLIINISEFFIQKGSENPIVDLGCTSGLLLSKLKKKYNYVNCIGYDKTSHNFISDDSIELRVADITNDFELPTSQIVYSVFTLQFIPYEFREQIIKKIYASLQPNGCFIFCEKEFANNAKFQEVYTFANYNNKAKQFSSEEIINKEKDIRSIMNPLKGEDNIKMLKKQGFKNIDVFFKSLNFTGYICQK